MDRRRSAFVVGFAGLMVLAGAMPAMGAISTGGAVTRTKDIVIAKNATGGGKVACPSGSRATAGGARWLPDGHSTGLALSSQRSLGASSPTDNARKWFASGFNADPAVDEATLRLSITCLPSSTVGPLTAITRRVSPPGATGGVKTTIGCGSGRRMVTGGAAWQVPGSPLDASLADDHVLSGSAPRTDGGGWFGAGTRSVSSTAELRVVAFCGSAAGVGPYQTRTRQFNPQGVNISFVIVMAGGSASCPSGTRVVNAGALWKDPFTGTTLAEGNLGSSAPAGKTAWYAAGMPSNNGTDRALVLVLQCRPT